MNNNHTIIHIVGNRPQFIKLAVMYNSILKQTDYKQFIIHTGQHSSKLMSNIFFEEMLIPEPDIKLSLNHTDTETFVGSASKAIREILGNKPSDTLVFVYGDTNSTLAAALAARRNGNKLLHCEAGVRTFNRTMPEEINRILTDRISDVNFCCTSLNCRNLEGEGYGIAIPAEVVLTGDLMLDAFMKIKSEEQNVVASKDYVACTIHRAENILYSENLSQIVDALNEIHKDTEVIIPMHPHTAARLKECGCNLECTVLPPLSYGSMKRFLKDSRYVITDSGGICRESFFSGKRSVIIMKSPFWPEIVEAGAALSCGTLKNEILKSFYRLKDLQTNFETNIFGDGKAAEKIVSYLGTIGN